MIKQINVLSILLSIAFTLVGCENKLTNNFSKHEINAGGLVMSSNAANNPSASQQANNDGKVYLLEGGIKPPSRVVLLAKQAEVLKSAKNKESAWKPFRYLDIMFESSAVESDLYNSLKDGKIGWDIMTDHKDLWWGYTYSDKSFTELADELINEAEQNISDELIHEDLEQARKLIHVGVQEHNVQKLVEAHKYIHDLHYWVVGYDIPFEIEPPTWEGLHVFFGVTKTLGKG